ncbi:hypothetical protein IBG34_08735 [Aeromonas media]|uniref:Uncharacterized protein n=1 Tax=Aeromonas media TaxID=651 RepID=A0A6M4YAS7_AERME|nr:hypothetical protein [Aeromonas media]QJT22357.1 hypothetical protein E4184_13645 [Aeromonas media]QYK82772.1 hypothetical protein IBG34_08735 [Aeromonas media]
MALIQIRATSLPTSYAVAFVSLKGCVYPMPMDFSSLLHRLLTDTTSISLRSRVVPGMHMDFSSLLLHRLLTDSHISSTSLKGEPGMPMDFSSLLRRLLTDSHIHFISLKGGA